MANAQSQADGVRRVAAWPGSSIRRRIQMLTAVRDNSGAQAGAFLARLAEAVPDLARAGEIFTGIAAMIRNALDVIDGPALNA